jgi:hypothetical protein
MAMTKTTVLKRFWKYLQVQYKIFVKSFTDTSYVNAISIVSDAGIVVIYLMLTALFSAVISGTFSAIDQFAQSFIGKSQFVLQSAVIIRSLGVMLLHYLLIAVTYSVLTGITWMMLLKKKITVKGLWRYTWKTIVYLFTAMLVLYAIMWLFKDGVWQLINFVILAFVLFILPVFHILQVQKDTKIVEALTFFFKYFKHFILPGSIMIVVFNVLVMSTSIFNAISVGVESLMTIIVALFVVSWARRYLSLLVRWLQR